MDFSKDNISIILYKEDDESDDIFIERGQFIINNYNKYDYNELIKLSKIWINYKYKKCNYNKRLRDIITELSNNIN